MQTNSLVLQHIEFFEIELDITNYINLSVGSNVNLFCTVKYKIRYTCKSVSTVNVGVILFSNCR